MYSPGLVTTVAEKRAHFADCGQTTAKGGKAGSQGSGPEEMSVIRSMHSDQNRNGAASVIWCWNNCCMAPLP